MKLSDKYLNIDCMDEGRGLPSYPDNHFQLSIIDPPYGINIAGTGSLGQDKFLAKDWDKKRPEINFFIELQRVSKNQIIWGWNYFSDLLPSCKGFIYWNKLNHHSNRSDGELAYCSINGLARHFEYMWDGNRYGYKNNIQGVGKPSIRIHPTQKPIQLYKWLLKNYANEGDLILDTHAGSCSSLIAFIQEGFDFMAYEIDKDYYKESYKRVIEVTSQTNLMDYCK